MSQTNQPKGTAQSHVQPSRSEVPVRGTPAGRGHLWVLAALLALAATARLVNVVETRSVPTVRHLIGDAAAYYDRAEGIASGQWLGRESFYQAPLYPYALAVIFCVFGAGVWAIRLVQVVWGAVSVWCLCYGTNRLFGRGPATVAGMMLALYVPAIFFDGIVQKASLGCLLVCGLIGAMGWLAGRGGWGRALVVGLLSGLLVLTRENAMVWLPVVAVWIGSLHGTGRGRSRLAMACAYGLGIGLVLLPVGVRNRVVGGEWSVSTFQAGPNFYIGNHHGAVGRYEPLMRGHETPSFERKDATFLAEQATGRRLSPREVSRYWMSRAWREIRAEPAWWFGLMARKMLMVWNRYEVSDAESLQVYADQSVVLRGLGSVWHFGVLCPLAAVGLVITRGQWRRLWVYYAMIVSMAMAVALFYVLARYRFPLIPLLIPFAAAGGVELWHRLRTRTLRALIGPVAAAVVIAVVVNWPVHDEARLDALAWMNVGAALAEEGDLAAATPYFRRAVEGHPDSPEANNNLAQALALQGQYDEAVTYYERSVAAAPDLMGVDYNLAVALEQVGRTAEALSHYECALRLDPSDEDARRAIERLGTSNP